MSIEDILMQRRTVSGCTGEVWKKRQEEEKKKKAEEIADKISSLMDAADEQVNKLVLELREVRQKEAIIKAQLDRVGLPFLYAKNGLYEQETPQIKQIAPLVAAMDETLGDFGFDDDVDSTVPADFFPTK